MISSRPWVPIEGPADPHALAVRQLVAFRQHWQEERARLKDHGAVARFNERMDRAWAIETGVIERLYDLSDGVTVQLVKHGFEAALIPHGESNIPPEDLIMILKDHLEAKDFLMDVIGGERPLSLSWIKELHALFTRHQITTEGVDSFGRRVQLELLRGQWKVRPNNPLTPEGVIHEYCPPEHVQTEMERLLSLYNAIPEELPEVRAAWLHHAFTCIHPFQDGNGRVARALASIDFIKAGLFPMLVLRAERPRYLDALRQADDGDLRPLVGFFAEVQARLIRKAISEADQVVSALAGRQTVLAAANERLQRRTDEASRARAALANRMDALLEDAVRVLRAAGEEVKAELPSIRVLPVKRASTSEERGYFRHQLLELGKLHDYWVDVNEHRDWARLQLKDGGVTDIIVACHFVGSAAAGVGVAVVFLQHRDHGEKVGKNAPMVSATGPFDLLIDEDAAQQRARFLDWLDGAINAALAQWTRFL